MHVECGSNESSFLHLLLLALLQSDDLVPEFWNFPLVLQDSGHLDLQGNHPLLILKPSLKEFSLLNFDWNYF
jgi:hypothetical protein